MNHKRLSESDDEKFIKAIGGGKTIASGAFRFSKTDGLEKNFALEGKTPEKPQKSITINKEDLTKLRYQAFSSGKDFYALRFNFGHEGHKVENYAVIPDWMFHKLYNFYKENNNE